MIDRIKDIVNRQQNLRGKRDGGREQKKRVDSMGIWSSSNTT